MNLIELDKDNNIVVQNTSTNEFVCSRKQIFDEDAYMNARCIWISHIEEYNKLNWFKRLVTQKPSEPNPASFLNI